LRKRLGGEREKEQKANDQAAKRLTERASFLCSFLPSRFSSSSLLPNDDRRSLDAKSQKAVNFSQNGGILRLFVSVVTFRFRNLQMRLI